MKRPVAESILPARKTYDREQVFERNSNLARLGKRGYTRDVGRSNLTRPRIRNSGRGQSHGQEEP